VIARIEARMQGRRGPRVLQPYFDLGKLFRKEALAPLRTIHCRDIAWSGSSAYPAVDTRLTLSPAKVLSSVFEN